MNEDRRQAAQILRALAADLERPVVDAQELDAYHADADGADVPSMAAADGGDATLTATATGVIRPFNGSVSDVLTAASTDDDAPLDGIIWGAGDHDLALGGQPTPVRVPEDTIPATFEALQEDVPAGDVGIGTDHPDPDSVAAQTGVVNIGTAEDVALSADEQYIVLTDSRLTSESAEAAHDRGDFQDKDFSVVADVALRRDQDGDPVVEDGRVVIDATRVRRIDVVHDGAVDAASIGDVPALAAHAETFGQAADAHNYDDAADALRALAASYTGDSQL